MVVDGGTVGANTDAIAEQSFRRSTSMLCHCEIEVRCLSHRGDPLPIEVDSEMRVPLVNADTMPLLTPCLLNHHHSSAT